MYYILDEKNNPIPTDGVMTWVAWYEEHQNEARMHMVTHIGDTEISTKFFN